MAFAQKPSACRGCPAEKVGRGFCAPAINKRASEAPNGTPRFAFLGDGPNERDAHASEHWTLGSDPGHRLTNWLYHAGLQRNSVWLGNLVQCWLPAGLNKQGSPWGQREPTRGEVEFCWAAHSARGLGVVASSGWGGQLHPTESAADEGVRASLETQPNLHLTTLGHAAGRFVRYGPAGLDLKGKGKGYEKAFDQHWGTLREVELPEERDCE